MPSVTDFSRSYVRWSVPADPDDNRVPGHMPWGNSVRIQIDALCRIRDRHSGSDDQFVLIAPCRKEWMYRDADLIIEPADEYRMVFSRDRQADVSMHRLASDNYVLPQTTNGFTSLEFELSELQARALRSNSEIVDASLSSNPIVTRMRIDDLTGARSAELEFPIRTMNYHPERQRFQVDTGPLLYPELTIPAEHPIDRCQLAHAVFNTLGYAEFAIRQPESAPGTASSEAFALNYSLNSRHKVETQLFAAETS